MEEMILNILANNGFAALVAGGLLWEINKTVNRLTNWVTKWDVKVRMNVDVKERENATE